VDWAHELGQLVAAKRADGRVHELAIHARGPALQAGSRLGSRGL
jgi:hypothetical protein